MKILKQPLIIGYILSGVIVGPLILNLIQNTESLQIFSEFGIAFLLFIVGLYLNPKTIKEVGKISLITGIGQVLFTSMAGYLLSKLMGFSNLTSIYIAVALTFSSTIIIMKLLSDKDSLDKLYGKISIGFLLIQDLIAILILIVISSITSGGNATNLIFMILLKGFILLVLLFLISYFILPKLSNFFAKSSELLFIFSISWGLVLSALFAYIGFSIEVGALIAGIMLSLTPYSYEISSKLKPLRDFFIVSFFILLGSQMIFNDFSSIWIPAIIFSSFILIGNPIIVMGLMGIFGYTKKTGFMAGLTVAQISEFSLILISLGVRSGHLSAQTLSLVTIVGLITIAGSTYMIIYSDKIFKFLSRYLTIFEKKKIRKEIKEHKEYSYLLFGDHRIGFSIMNSYIKNKKKYLVVDFNPERVKKLRANKINCLYGDVSDVEFLEELKLRKSKLIVSTIPEFETNLLLLNKIKEKNKKAIVILTANQIIEANILYKKGADYVILPQIISGEHISKLMENLNEDKSKYKEEKTKQMKELQKLLQGKV
jgi:Kef-type K+ transport system membrane component KefB